MDIVKKDSNPEYFDVIKNPMCFNDMKKKLENKSYLNLEQFEHDITLIVDNAKKFNNSLTIFHKKAIKLQEHFDYLKEQILV